MALLLSKRVRDTARAILADPALGFNKTYAALQSSYGAPSIAFDFTSASANFAQSHATSQMADLSSNYGYPLMLMYASDSDNTRDIKYAVFSGQVILVIDIYISWELENISFDMESWGDAIEDTMYSVFNGMLGTNSFTQAGVIYNGELSLNRQPLQFSGENWTQLLSFRLMTGRTA